MSYEMISENYVVARKDHKCEWCGETILRGERHYSRAYKFCGDFQTGKMHLECCKAMDATPHDDLADGWIFGEMKRGSLDNKQDSAR